MRNCKAPHAWRAPEGPEGPDAVPVGGGRAWATHRQQAPARLEAAAGPAGPGRTTSRRAAPHISDQAPPVWRPPEGPAAVPVGGGGAWPGFETTRRAKLAARTARGRAAAHRHTQRPGPPAPGTPAGPQAPRPANAPRDGRRSVGAAPQHAHTPPRHNKTARPQWGRAAVAVALGFEPRVAVTPHSISSAAPSAARTRYLTRILYYTLPLRAQIDRAGWEQGHIAVWEQGPARSHNSTRNRRHLTI